MLAIITTNEEDLVEATGLGYSVLRTTKNTVFCWTHRHEQAFQATKAALTSDTVMDYFDKHKNTELITDA